MARQGKHRQGLELRLKCLLWSTHTHTHKHSALSLVVLDCLGCCFHLNWNQIKVFSLTKWNCAFGFVLALKFRYFCIRFDSIRFHQRISVNFLGICLCGFAANDFLLFKSRQGFGTNFTLNLLALLWLIVSSIIYSKVVFPFAKGRDL